MIAKKLGLLCLALVLVSSFAPVVSAETVDDAQALVLDQTEVAPQMCMDEQQQQQEEEEPALESCYPPECSTSADCFGARCFQRCCWF
jgi:hypothetical protein